MKFFKCDECNIELGLECRKIPLYHSFGYGTQYDGQVLDIDLCEPCLIKFFRKFIL